MAFTLGPADEPLSVLAQSQGSVPPGYIDPAFEFEAPQWTDIPKEDENSGCDANTGWFETSHPKHEARVKCRPKPLLRPTTTTTLTTSSTALTRGGPKRLQQKSSRKRLFDPSLRPSAGGAAPSPATTVPSQSPLQHKLSPRKRLRAGSTGSARGARTASSPFRPTTAAVGGVIHSPVRLLGPAKRVSSHSLFGSPLRVSRAGSCSRRGDDGARSSRAPPVTRSSSQKSLLLQPERFSVSTASSNVSASTTLGSSSFRSRASSRSRMATRASAGSINTSAMSALRGGAGGAGGGGLPMRVLSTSVLSQASTRASLATATTTHGGRASDIDQETFEDEVKRLLSEDAVGGDGGGEGEGEVEDDSAIEDAIERHNLLVQRGAGAEEGEEEEEEDADIAQALEAHNRRIAQQRTEQEEAASGKKRSRSSKRRKRRPSDDGDDDLREMLARHNSKVIAQSAKYDIHGRRVWKPEMPRPPPEALQDKKPHKAERAKGRPPRANQARIRKLRGLSAKNTHV